MKRFSVLFGAALALSVLASASGESAVSKGPYVNLGYSVFHQSFESAGGLLEPSVISVTDLPNLRSNTLDLSFGYNFNQFLALEGHFGGGVDSSTKTVSASGTDGENAYDFESELSADMKSWVGLYVKPQMPLGPLNGYVLLGYAFTDMAIDSAYNVTVTDGFGISDVTAGTGRISQSDSGFSYGIGISDKIGENWQMSIEYKRLPDIAYDNTQTKGEIDGWSLSFGYQY